MEDGKVAISQAPCKKKNNLVTVIYALAKKRFHKVQFLGIHYKVEDIAANVRALTPREWNNLRWPRVG